MKKIVRSVCCFSQNPSQDLLEKINQVSGVLENNGYIIQTKRICSPQDNFLALEEKVPREDLLYSIGTLDFDFVSQNLKDFYKTKNTSFNIDLTDVTIEEKHVNMLLDIIKEKPEKTFEFAYVFNNITSSPFFPSAQFEKEGFAIGLEPTSLSENCKTLDEWLENMRSVWEDIVDLFKDESDFLGIDSSIAPFKNESSLVGFIKRLGFSFNDSVNTDLYLQMTNFIKTKNPKPVGLCGLMLPCLEDFDLAEEYEQGNFPIDRNIYLSLHSGLGIDTYPIGIDEDPKRILNILQLLQGLSKKHNKPLSARFASDGKSKIGERSDFGNQYLKDVMIRSL